FIPGGLGQCDFTRAEGDKAHDEHRDFEDKEHCAGSFECERTEEGIPGATRHVAQQTAISMGGMSRDYFTRNRGIPQPFSGFQTVVVPGPKRCPSRTVWPRRNSAAAMRRLPAGCNSPISTALRSSGWTMPAATKSEAGKRSSVKSVPGGIEGRIRTGNGTA